MAPKLLTLKQESCAFRRGSFKLTEKQPKKRAFYLFEILIGLTLMAMILSFLFTSMARSAKFEAKIESARNALFERGSLQTRLQDLFFSVQRDRQHPIYTQRFPGEKKTSLVAVFDNGIDPDPVFSGAVLGRIFLDEQRNLALVTWPLEKSEKKRPWRKEILLSRIDDFHFQLLDPSEAQSAWSDQWPKNRQGIPSMVRLFVSQNGTTLSFAFFFSSFEPLITYNQ